MQGNESKGKAAMKVKRLIKESFSVIGIEGSSLDGEGFVQRCWKEANLRFEEIKHLAKKDENGNFAGFWGAMSDLSHSFKPWENDFTEGLYLAGAECSEDAEAPEGWVKWKVPGYEYIVIECENDSTFKEGLCYLKEQGLSLSDAVHDFTCPETGKNFLFFPIHKI